MSKSKFDFYEKVLIRSQSARGQCHGQIATIGGKSQTKDGSWHYALFMPGGGPSRMFAESELESTGQFSSGEDFYDGSIVQVRVDDQGRGFIVGEKRPNNWLHRTPGASLAVPLTRHSVRHTQLGR